MKRHRPPPVIRSALACTVMLATLGPLRSARADGEATPQYAPVSFETKFENLGADRTKRIQPVLDRSAIDALQSRHHIDVVDDGKAKIVLHLFHLDEGTKGKREAAVLNYGILIEVQVDGEVVGDSDVTCMDKGEAELVGCAIEGLPSVFDHLPVEEPAAEEPTGTPPPRPVDNGDEQVGPRPVAPIGGWGIAGAVIGAGGVATAIAGGVYLGRGNVKDGPNGTGRDDFTDFRPPGRILLGVGLGALVVGVVMVAADVGVRAKKRKQAAAHFQLDGGPGFAGASLRGRF